MNLTRFVCVAALASLSLVACGDDETEEEEIPQGSVNGQIAQSTAQSVISAVNLARTSGDGPGAAFALAGAGASAFSIVAPAGAAPQAYGTARQRDSHGTCDCTGTSCTFTDCTSDGTSGATWSISGTMSWDGEMFMCDLTITGDFQGFSYSMHETCDLALTATSVDGSLATDGSYEIPAQAGVPGGASASWTSSMGFNMVEFDGNGCPTSGSLDVSSSVTAGGAQYAGSGTVTFTGEGCF
jgi:hypothetical protein